MQNLINSSEKNKHPKGLYFLSFFEMWDRFIYYGILTQLVLYLTKVFLFSDDKTFDFFGVFCALGFALPVLGGILADKILGFYRAIVIGGISLVVGNILLALPQKHFLYLGMAILVCGIGLFKTNLTSFVGTLYKEDDTKKDRGYTIFFMGMTLGAVLGPLVFGIMIETLGWHYGFMISAMAISVNLIALLLLKEKYNLSSRLNPLWLSKNKNIFNLTNRNIFYFCFPFSISILSLLFMYPKYGDNLVGVFSILIFAFMATVISRKSKEHRRKILMLLLLSGLSLVYFSASFQLNSTFILFVSKDIDLHYFGLNFPPTAFASLEPFFSFLLAPFFIIIWRTLTKKRREPNSISKLGIGFLLSGAGFGVFILSTVGSIINHNIALLFLIIGNVLFGAAEVCIIPTIMSAISKFSPKNYFGTFMGMWFLSAALGGYMSSVIAKLSDGFFAPAENVIGFSHVFAFVSLLLFAMSILSFFSSRCINNLIAK